MKTSDYAMSMSLPVMKIAQEREAFRLLGEMVRDSPEWLSQRELIVRSNLKLAVAAAMRSRARNLDPDDRVSEAMMVLVKCVEKFDYTTGIKFGTYVMRAINNSFTKTGVRENRHVYAPMEAADWFPSRSEEDENLAHIKEILDRNLAGLDPVEMRLVRARFYTGDDSIRKYKELGQMLGLGKERARQIVANAMEKIRCVV